MRFKNIPPFKAGDQVYYRYEDGRVETDTTYVVRKCWFGKMYGEDSWNINLLGYIADYRCRKFIKVTDVCQSIEVDF